MLTSILRQSAQGLPNEWSVALPYGAARPEGGVGAPRGAASGLVRLLRNGNSAGELLAPFAGKINIQPPTGAFTSTRKSALVDYISPLTGASQITLYLETTLIKRSDKYKNTLRHLMAGFFDSDVVATEGDRVGDFVECFVFANLDAESVRAAIIGSAVSIKNNTRAAGTATADWGNFLLGRRPISVKAGAPLGQVATGSTCSIGVLTPIGLIDPRLFFEAAIAENCVEAAELPAVEELLAVLPVSQPAIPLNASVNTVGTDRLYRWPDLMAWRAVNRPPWLEWRGIIDRQKAFFMARLADRVRPRAQGRRFVFNEEDARNPIQLEAIAEFYLNLPEPDNEQAPLPSAQNAGYRMLDFADLFGRAAEAQGTTVTLDGSPTLNRVVCGRDVLELDGETKRPGKQFRIMGVAAGNVIVDEPPRLVNSSSWRILQDPVVVLIDDCGARISGSVARRTAPNVLKLESLSETEAKGVERSNRLYDTIGLIDAAEGQRSDFRILDVTVTRTPNQLAEALITLDGDPSLAGESRWAIPAGLGGRQAPVPWSRVSQFAPLKWYDQYDGRLFVTTGDRIPVVLPWTSLTSRKEERKYLSSVDGNRHYRITSALTAKHNTTFKVVDAKALPHGNSALSPGGQSSSRVDLDIDTLTVEDYAGANGWMLYLVSATPPRSLELPLIIPKHEDDIALRRVHIAQKYRTLRPVTPTPYWLALYDGVRHAAFYFSDTVTPDEALAGPPTVGNALGKCGIRMHVGGIEGTGSQGCLVSPWYWSFRNVMALLHERRHRTYYIQHSDADLVVKANDISRNDPPAVAEEFLRRDKRLKYLVDQLSMLEGAVRAASQEAGEIGGDEFAMTIGAVPEILNEIKERRLTHPKDGDAPDPERVYELLDDLAELIESDAAVSLDELRDTPIALRLASLARLRHEVDEAREAREAEGQRVGWTHALQSDLYIIRPHERRLG